MTTPKPVIRNAYQRIKVGDVVTYVSGERTVESAVVVRKGVMLEVRNGGATKQLMACDVLSIDRPRGY